MSISGI